MTFQSSFAELEFIPTCEADQSFLQQIQKTTNKPIQKLKERIKYDDNDEEMIQEKQIQEKQIQEKQPNQNQQSALKGYKVYKDYNVTLHLTDINFGVKGHNKFYIIQLLLKDDEFFLYTKWGRTGAQHPQVDLKPTESGLEAMTLFKRKFRDKTHQEWDDRQNFQQQQGKYAIVQVSGDEQNLNDEIEKVNRRNILLKNQILNIPSKLDERLKNLLSQIWDIQRMNKTLKDLNFDITKTPLGRLSQSSIYKGYKILNEIQTVLKTTQSFSKLSDLTNQFYTVIPQNFGMKKPPIIDNFEILGKKNNLLNVLQELETANKYTNLSISQGTENPLDIFYKLMKCDISLCEDMSVLNSIDASIKNSHGPTHDKFRLQVLEVYNIKRRQENIKFYPFSQMENRKLLWHGSRTTNFVGILSEGLRIAPPEAPTTGYMFGKGIYFADICSKSAAYCHANIENPEGFVLLCEVALGNQYQVFKAKELASPPLGHHSVHGVGRNHSQKKDKIRFDLDIEVGEVIPSEFTSDLIYNEFIIYDTAQVRLKYLVKLKFIF